MAGRKTKKGSETVQERRQLKYQGGKLECSLAKWACTTQFRSFCAKTLNVALFDYRM